MKIERVEIFHECLMVANGIMALFCVVSFFAWLCSDLKVFGTLSLIFFLISFITGVVRKLFFER